MMGDAWDIPWGITPEEIKERKLRQEYPDLMDKWKVFKNKEVQLDGISVMFDSFTFMSRIFKSGWYIYVSNEYQRLQRAYPAAKQEYFFLEKLLQD